MKHLMDAQMDRLFAGVRALSRPTAEDRSRITEALSALPGAAVVNGSERPSGSEAQLTESGAPQASPEPSGPRHLLENGATPGQAGAGLAGAGAAALGEPRRAQWISAV